MISLRQLSLYRGGRPLLQQVDLTVHPGQRVAVVGANGGGKSSFFALLTGQLHQDSGTLELPAGAVISHVEQEVDATDKPAVEYVIDGDAELRAVEQEIARHAEGERLAALYSRFDEIDGFSARARALKLMHGLGFADPDADRAVGEFSGGWRMRLNLARALMCRSDILLLDEPTNHLDLEAVIWLEQWLKSYGGTLLLISHDRDFIDGVATHVCHLEQKTLKLYTGNYADFERQRSANLSRQQAAFDKQQRQIAHLHSYVERFRAKATKARQAQSRIKALERMELISAAHVDSPFSFSFATPPSCSSPILALESVSCGYADKTVLRGVTLAVEPGDRIGLIGGNGAGKSTLVKLIAGLIEPGSGRRVEAKGLVIGYFAQHQLESLRGDESPLQHLMRQEKDSREQDLRDYLGGFDFRGDAAFAKVGTMSGGERARLALALIIRTRPNLLLLDEPTNHLDLEMRHALTLALQDFEGALVVVSHDRHLIRTTVDQLLLVKDGAVSVFEGDLDGYRERVVCEPVAQAKKNDKKSERQRGAEARKLRRPIEVAISDLERQMDAARTEREAIDQRLADPEFYSDKSALKEALSRQAELASAIDQFEEKWFDLHGQLETLDGLSQSLGVQ